MDVSAGAGHRVHGILLCHADTPGAIRPFVEAVRFPLHAASIGRI